ncbi:MAG: glycosyltransferase [Alphaproteobacteria bacterium]|nr:glycosyltransferase [Alphaproteobacteria bacterium]
MNKVFIGFDPNETVAFHVLNHSIQARASAPIAVIPIMLSQLTDVFKRERNQLQSTEFSFSRFLVPYMSDFEGWSLFMDCDMLMLGDVHEIFRQCDDRFAVQCVKHDHRPQEETKFLGATQTQYAKKNWSSVMMFNNARCTALTPDYVNTATGLELHQFKWLSSDDEIGELSHEWNHLVGYDPTVPVDQVRMLHYTEGGPYFEDYTDTDYADVWFKERDAMLYAKPR